MWSNKEHTKKIQWQLRFLDPPSLGWKPDGGVDPPFIMLPKCQETKVWEQWPESGKWWAEFSKNWGLQAGSHLPSTLMIWPRQNDSIPRLWACVGRTTGKFSVPVWPRPWAHLRSLSTPLGRDLATPLPAPPVFNLQYWNVFLVHQRLKIQDGISRERKTSWFDWMRLK